MNPSSPLVRITCEFASVDHAELCIGRLIRSNNGVQRPQVPRQTPLKQDHAFFRSFFFVIDADYHPGTFWLFDKEPQSFSELRQIQSITTELLCPAQHLQEVTGKLTSLGASHIRVR